MLACTGTGRIALTVHKRSGYSKGGRHGKSQLKNYDLSDTIQTLILSSQTLSTVVGIYGTYESFLDTVLM